MASGGCGTLLDRQRASGSGWAVVAGEEGPVGAADRREQRQFEEEGMAPGDAGQGGDDEAVEGDTHGVGGAIPVKSLPGITGVAMADRINIDAIPANPTDSVVPLAKSPIE